MLIGASGSSPLVLLAVLACPVGMGVMMLFMGKGMMGGKKTAEPRDDIGSLADMKAEQARLAEKISALEERQTSEREPDPVS